MADTLTHLPAFIAKMAQERLPAVVIETFRHYYEIVVSGNTGHVSEKDIDPVDYDDIAEYEDLAECAEEGKKALGQAIKIVLNGGLGTSMGLMGPKSLLEVRDGKTFLDIILLQAEAAGIPLALMNSFSTQAETLNFFAAQSGYAQPLIFMQHKFPKIRQADLGPICWPADPDLEWNPPGHGDVYTALFTSGMLEKLLERGIRYALINNVDNLGAVMDERLLGYFASNQFPFMMEVTQRTPSDIKGGHLARLKDGLLILREIAQCPPDELAGFEDIRRYPFFNANNLWVNLIHLKELIESQKILRLPMILNPKTVDPRDPSSPAVYQIETAMGAAVSLFEGATAVKVPGARFYPVKKTNELMAVRSDCFVFTDQSRIMLNPQRKSGRPKIDLDPKYYTRIDQFDKRFPDGVPSLLACESLTIHGDVKFAKDVALKGEVVIENRGKSQALIEAGSVIEADLILD